MLETMYVRCTHCGYDNSPEYRFCGMCGASLARPPVVAEPPAKEISRQAAGEATTENVHGPSFLGLAEDPKVEFHYLYEDEQPRSHVGLVMFLVILLGAGGYLGWQWRHNGFPFNRLSAANSAASGAGASPSAAPASDAAQAASQDASNDKPATPAAEAQPTPPPDKSQADQSAKANQAAAANGNSASGSDQNQAESASQPPAEKPASPPETTDEAKATPPPHPRERSSEVKPGLSRERAAKAAELDTGVKTPPDADLELAGEKYLYGTGVQQNCVRAESSLRTAATHGNSKAETVLGTMYATGHCVGRDLPTAYRWFARALHQEPQNTRISADLQVLWHQMTPQEQQLATSNR